MNDINEDKSKESIIWEEENSIEPEKKLTNKPESECVDIINVTVNESVKKNSNNITKKEKMFDDITKSKFRKKRTISLIPKILELINLGYRIKHISKMIKMKTSTISSILIEYDIDYKFRPKNILGETFGKLKVISFSRKDNNNKTVWNCLCGCGNKHEARYSDLTSGKINSCGCIRNDLSSNRLKKYRENVKNNHKEFHNWKGIGDLSGRHIARIKRSAFCRKIELNITKEYLWDLFLKQNKKCALSGVDIVFIKKSNKTTASLDRIDSSKGYIEGNVQWVHKDINTMKWNHPTEYFIKMCQNVVNHNKKYNE